MFSTRRPSLSYAPFRASLLVILVLALFVGIFWMANEYQTYKHSIANIEENYQALYRARVEEEVNRVFTLIEQRCSQANLHIENELRVKVQSAYTIASHVYRMYKDEKSVAELRSMVAEILRPIRWNNGLGSYFSGRLEADTIDLFADDPLLEGKGLQQVKEQAAISVIQDSVSILKEKGAGLYRYRSTEENLMTNRNFPGTVFVKYFEPFDWYIGAGLSNAAMEEKLREEILAALQTVRFSKDGYILCFRLDGTIISHPNEHFIGRSVTDLSGEQGSAYSQNLLSSRLGTGIIEHVLYRSTKPHLDQGRPRLSFLKLYSDWNWIVAADISMAAMEKAIQDATLLYTTRSFKKVSIFIGLFAAAVLLLLSMAYYHSTKIKHAISLFTDFFRKAAHTQVKIRDTDMAFSEFENLGRLANSMVDDHIEKKRILYRDELRLDTLLQLGNMDDFDIKDKYDFVLHRILQITRSDRGYISLVNHAQTYTTLCSQACLSTGQLGLDPKDDIAPHSLQESGVISHCVAKKEACLMNDCPKNDQHPPYPYSLAVRRRVDIPISDSSKVVLVAGVCNSDKNYDNADIRQMTMLLEGLWLHVLKTCSEKELAKLERQVIAIGEEERSKIGRDLHDDLGSHLSGVELLSKVLQQKLEKQAPEQAEQLAAIRNLIREAIEKTSRLSRGLYPVHIIEHGMEAAIEELLAEIEQLYAVQCTLSFDHHAAPLAANIAPHVYYIIREALFNAARHGKPDTIRVVIVRDGNRLSVTIADDGLGMAGLNSKKGLGLHTMQYRAKAIGAALDISPGVTRGTVVTLSGEMFS